LVDEPSRDAARTTRGNGLLIGGHCGNEALAERLGLVGLHEGEERGVDRFVGCHCGNLHALQTGVDVRLARRSHQFAWKAATRITIRDALRSVATSYSRGSGL
jgi:hypothetical protein